jgi:tetratricopeptide (TPR) repeat protein
LDHLETALAGYDPDRYGLHRYQLGNNYGVIGFNVTSLLLWMVGLPDRALERATQAVALARRLDHPYSLAYATFHIGVLHLWRREADLALQRSLAVLEHAREHEFLVWSAVATCLKGAALAELGQPEEGLAQIRRGIDSYQGLNTAPIFLSLLIFMQAEICGLAGKPAQGLAIIDSAFEGLEPGREDLFSIETYRIKGDLMLAAHPDDPTKAEQSYLRALEIAQEQGTNMLELRAAMRLARLWQDGAKGEQGRRLLGVAYAKFSEGFTTPDLLEAGELLRAG